MDHAVSVIPENKTVTTYYQLCDCIIDAYPIKQILIILETQIQEAHIIFLKIWVFSPENLQSNLNNLFYFGFPSGQSQDLLAGDTKAYRLSVCFSSVSNNLSSRNYA